MTKLVTVKKDTTPIVYTLAGVAEATHFCHKGVWYAIDEFRTVVINSSHRAYYVTTRGTLPFLVKDVTLGCVAEPAKTSRLTTITLTDRQASTLALILSKVKTPLDNKDDDVEAVGNRLFYELFDTIHRHPTDIQIKCVDRGLVLETRPC